MLLLENITDVNVFIVVLQLFMAVTISLYFLTLVLYTGYAPLQTPLASSLPSDDYQALFEDDRPFPKAKAYLILHKPLVDPFFGIGDFQPYLTFFWKVWDVKLEVILKQIIMYECLLWKIVIIACFCFVISRAPIWVDDASYDDEI